MKSAPKEYIMREELLYARKREQEADKQRREVIASISHDIKNPVASIQAIAEYQSVFVLTINTTMKKVTQRQSV